MVRDGRVRTALLASGLGLAMVGLGFASVPLYQMFCAATGFGGTTSRVSEREAAGVRATGNVISVRFDSNVAKELPWSFRAERSRASVRIGDRSMMIFVAKNMSDRPITGRASFNVTPSQSGQYFTKVQCFCFTEQTLQPGQEVRMPVIYYVDPKMLEDADAETVQEITLSYTFFPVDEAGTGS